MSTENYMEELGASLKNKLGEAIWGFSKIEALTYEYIERLRGEEFLRLIGDQGIKVRIDILRKISKLAEKNHLDLFKALSSALKEVDKLAVKRNIIVHNPWQIYLDLEKMDFVAEIVKYLDDSKKISISDVEQFIQDVDETYNKLASNLEALTKLSL